MFCKCVGIMSLAPDSKHCNFLRTDRNTTKLGTSFFFPKIIKIMPLKQR